MTAQKVLIIEDDTTLQRVLKDNFEFSGYEVCIAGDGRKGWLAVREFKPDLILLDIMLPEVNGFDVCRKIRKQEYRIPIIMLTAKGQESDMVLGLNLGADDYITKPFSIDVLLARAAACLRRHRNHKNLPDIIEFGRCKLDLTSHSLFRDGKEMELTPKEFGLLQHFVANIGRALTRDGILDAVWGEDMFVTQRSVDRCVNTLRSKIESNPQRPQFIKTIRDMGYRFELSSEN
jgi:DNA-binding response OmpR family regulator